MNTMMIDRLNDDVKQLRKGGYVDDKTWTVTMLTNIASSLAVIADLMMEREVGRNEDTD